MKDMREYIVEVMNEIEDDSRYKAKPALVEINAPLALIQVSLAAKMDAYRTFLAMIDGNKLLAAAPGMLILLNEILGWDGILPHSKTRIRDEIAKATG